MADNKNVSMTQEEYDRTKAALDLYEKISEVVDKTRGVSKKRAEDLQKEIEGTETVLDLTKKIEEKKQKITKLETTYSAIQKNIAKNEYQLQASNERSGIIKDQVKLQQELLTWKERQFQQEIASGKITERTAAARRREIQTIKDTLAAKQREEKIENYIQSVLQKKIAGGLDAAKNIALRIKTEKDGLKILEEQLRITKNLVRTTQEIEQFVSANAEEYDKVKKFLSDISKGGMRAWLAMLNASLARWKELDVAAFNFRQTTGFLVSQTKNLDNAVRQVNVQMANLGIGLKEAYEAASSLTEEFQVIGLVTKEAIANTAMVAANLGLNVKDAAKFKGLFESISQSVGSSGDSMIKSAAALADMAGVAPRAVLNDMANASEDTLAFLSKSPMALIRATVEARRLGTTVNSLSKSARGFLNYQDSITSELEASALIGKSLNFQEARAAAYAGDVVKSRELALKQIEKAGDFTRLNVYQQEALAKAAGMTTAEIIKQQNQQKLLARLEQNKPELYKKYMAMQQKIKENEKAAAADLDKQSEEMAKQQLMQGEINKLTNAFSGIWTDISDSLLAIANTIMPPIIIAARLLGATFKIITAIIRGFLSPFDKFVSKLRSGEEGGLTLEKIMTKIGEGVEKIIPYAEKLGELVSLVVRGFMFLGIMSGKLFTELQSFQAVVAIFKGMGLYIKDIFTNLSRVSGIGARTSSAFNWIPSTIRQIANFTNMGFSAVSKLFGAVGGIGQHLGPVTKVFGVFGKIFGSVGRFVGLFAKAIPGIGQVITAIQILWELGTSLFSIWTDDNLSIGQKIIASLKAVPGAIFEVIVSPLIDIGAWILKMFGVDLTDGMIDGFKASAKEIFTYLMLPFIGVYEWIAEKFLGNSPSEIGLGIVDGIKSVGKLLYNALIQPFVNGYKWIKKKLMGDSPSEIGLGIVDGIKSIGGMLLNAFTLPFRNVVNFVSKLFGGRSGSVGESIIKGVKSIMGGVFDFLISPFKAAFNFIKNIPFIGKMLGGGDATATINTEAKVNVEKQTATTVEVKNLYELKETINKLIEAIAALGGVAGGASPVVNVSNNQNAMIEKLDELIGLLKDGAIVVNMDGIQVSRTLAKVT